MRDIGESPQAVLIVVGLPSQRPPLPPFGGAGGNYGSIKSQDVKVEYLYRRRIGPSYGALAIAAQLTPAVLRDYIV